MKFYQEIRGQKPSIYYIKNKKDELFLMLNYSFQFFDKNNNVEVEEDKTNYWGSVLNDDDWNFVYKFIKNNKL